jgi:F-type H+-transporting ATPase subunit b
MRLVPCIALILTLTTALLLGPWSLAAADVKKDDSAAKPAAAGHQADAAHKPAGGSHGSGERDVFEVRGDLGIWTLVVFLGLFFLLRKYAWGPILQGLHQREANIKGAIAEAETLRAESAKLKDQLAAEMAKASDKVREIMEEARRDAQHLTEDMIGKARAEIQAERERLQRELRMAQDAALKELWDQAANLAALISSKAIRRELTPADHSKLLDEALAEFGKQGKQYVENNFAVRN